MEWTERVDLFGILQLDIEIDIIVKMEFSMARE
jgi:hypothetical protein